MSVPVAVTIARPLFFLTRIFGFFQKLGQMGRVAGQHRYHRLDRRRGLFQIDEIRRSHRLTDPVGHGIGRDREADVIQGLKDLRRNVVCAIFMPTTATAATFP